MSNDDVIKELEKLKREKAELIAKLEAMKQEGIGNLDSISHGIMNFLNQYGDNMTPELEKEYKKKVKRNDWEKGATDRTVEILNMIVK